jgi:DNA-binding NarL/FixJ family response regulator
MAARRTVLVVDPNPNTRERVATAIAGNDFEIVDAKDALEAETVAATKNVVLVLASASLPRGNGYDLASRLRVTHPRAVVFLLSGGFEAFDSGRAQLAGVVGRIPKPFSTDTLLFHINAAVGALSNLGHEEIPVVEAAELDLASVEPMADKAGTDRRARQPEEEVDTEAVTDPGDLGIGRAPREGELPEFDGAIVPISEDREPARPVVRERPKGRRPLGVPDPQYRPPTSSERIATFLPRDYEELPRVAVDPAVVGPAVEQAILEVLPEVVETVLRRTLETSGTLRSIVEAAVEEAIKKELAKRADGA